MRLNPPHTSTRLDIPNPVGVVVGCGNEMFTCGMEDYRADPIVVAHLRRAVRGETGRRRRTKVQRHCPRIASQSLTVLSLDPVTTYAKLNVSSSAGAFIDVYARRQRSKEDKRDGGTNSRTAGTAFTGTNATASITFSCPRSSVLTNPDSESIIAAV